MFNYWTNQSCSINLFGLKKSLKNKFLIGIENFDLHLFQAPQQFAFQEEKNIVKNYSYWWHHKNMLQIQTIFVAFKRNNNRYLVSNILSFLVSVH